jgi:hypothetical protein
MKLRHLRQLALRISRAYPADVLKCERDLIRTWDGCVYYLLRHSQFLREVCTQPVTADEPIAPTAAEDSGALLPPIAEILARIDKKSV